MKKQWLLILIVMALTGFWAKKKYFREDNADSRPTSTEVEGAGYWTCPMHPQIHLLHSGECPICHMKLVQVKAHAAQAKETSRAKIQVSQQGLNLIGVEKEQVQKMDLCISIPVSGSFLTSSSVAFQVYESDLRFVKPGATFKGQNSDSEISGIISSVDSIVDPTSRTIRVIGRIEKGPKGLVSETTFSGLVETKLKGRVSIAESSVLHTGTGDIVYIFEGGNNLSARKVMLGAKSEGFFEVISGLLPGDFISSGPNFLIDSEAKIRGTSNRSDSENRQEPVCSDGQHWNMPMEMCMPGKGQ